MMYIIDSANPTKFKALMNALGELPSTDIAVRKILVEGAPDVKPCSLAEAERAAYDGVNALVRTFLKQDDRDDKPAIAICLQKGIDISGAVPKLICIVAARRTDTEPTMVKLSHCRSFDLDQKVKMELEKNPSADPYIILGKVYGEDVAVKSKPLLEKVDPIMTETIWFSEGIKNILLYL